jgi:hypothetical protein
VVDETPILGAIESLQAQIDGAFQGLSSRVRDLEDAVIRLNTQVPF